MSTTSNAPTRRGSSQLTLRAILLVFVPLTLALAFPEFAFLAPMAIALFVIIAGIIVAFSAVDLIFTDDRRAVIALAWLNLRALLIATLLAIAYFAYAWYVCEIRYGD